MGAMKSLAYDYAIFLASPDKNYDVINDIFAEIVNGDIEIPQDYVTQWVDKNSVFASEDVVFDAETKSWRQQKRDEKGRFSKGFPTNPSDDYEDVFDEVTVPSESHRTLTKKQRWMLKNEEAGQYQEMIEPYYKYVDLDKDMDLTPELFSTFLEAAISDEEFPEKLTDPYFFQYLQKIAEAVPLQLLEQLKELLEMQNEVGRVSGDRNTEILGGRGVFITDILLNIKVGQESWAAEESIRPLLQTEGLPYEIVTTDFKSSMNPKDRQNNDNWFVTGDINFAVPDNQGNYGRDSEIIVLISTYGEGTTLDGAKENLIENAVASLQDDYSRGYIERNAEEELTYTEAEINLMRYDLVEHELENADYNYLYDIMLYGTEGWANLPPEEIIQKFSSIFERS